MRHAKAATQPRAAAVALLATLAVVVLAGCGSSSDGITSVGEAENDTAQELFAATEQAIKKASSVTIDNLVQYTWLTTAGTFTLPGLTLGFGGGC